MFCVFAQEATSSQGSKAAANGKPSTGEARRGVLATRNMAQFVNVRPSKGFDYDATAEAVLAQVSLTGACAGVV
jgi:hypothetical protein